MRHTVDNTEDPKLHAFIAEIREVCKRHDMALVPDSYDIEDSECTGLEVRSYDERLVDVVLGDALDKR